MAGAAAAVALVDHLGPAGARQLARGVAGVCFWTGLTADPRGHQAGRLRRWASSTRAARLELERAGGEAHQ